MEAIANMADNENEKIELVLSYAERLNERYGNIFVPLPKFEKEKNNNDQSGNAKRSQQDE